MRHPHRMGNGLIVRQKSFGSIKYPSPFHNAARSTGLCGLQPRMRNRVRSSSIPLFDCPEPKSLNLECLWIAQIKRLCFVTDLTLLDPQTPENKRACDPQRSFDETSWFVAMFFPTSRLYESDTYAFLGLHLTTDWREIARKTRP
ncbi:hypothetical protein [Ruegeria sp. HKCCA4707]|uniref:hypothetical protein n=1 Tax=Ruegeria sp. HKCCA4707 TaxID=2682984 RepID=UPI001489B8EB|nr:hypothetical protein [Ruegeria sp. HKCCA4707]